VLAVGGEAARLAARPSTRMRPCWANWIGESGLAVLSGGKDGCHASGMPIHKELSRLASGMERWLWKESIVVSEGGEVLFVVASNSLATKGERISWR